MSRKRPLGGYYQPRRGRDVSETVQFYVGVTLLEVSPLLSLSLLTGEFAWFFMFMTGKALGLALGYSMFKHPHATPLHCVPVDHIPCVASAWEDKKAA